MKIKEFLEKASILRIAVIGDYINDKYVYGEADRISPEAPIPVVRVTSHKENPGGAGNVVKNLMNLGVQTNLFFNALANSTKTRVMVGNHHMLRIDEEPELIFHNTYQSVEWREPFEEMLHTFDCVVLADYHKGTISKDIAQNVIDLCLKKGIPVVVDAKRDYNKYQHATVVKCNHKEWSRYSDEEEITREEFCSVFDVTKLVVTFGDQGIVINGIDYEDTVDGINVNIVDVCGAGDTVTAMLAICWGVGVYDGKAIELANAAAAEVCKYPGVYAITKEDLLKIEV